MSSYLDADLELYIEKIRVFPDIIAKQFWQKTLRAEQIETEIVGGVTRIWVTTEKLEAAIRIGLKQMKIKHTALADWLRYYLMNDSAAPSQDWRTHYKPFADVYLARLKLCQEMWLEPELQTCFSSPGHLWAEWILSDTLVIADQLFQGENLCGLTSKTNWQKQVRSTFLKIETHLLHAPLVEHQASKTALLAQIPQLHPSLLSCRLEELAIALAGLSKTFDADYAYYLKKVKALHAAVKCNVALQLNYFRGEEMCVSQRSKQASTSRSRKSKEL